MRSRFLLCAAFVALVGGCASTSLPGVTKACTEIGCGNDGIQVDFSHNEAGNYTVTVVVDGKESVCTASIPLKASDTNDACVAAGIYLTQSGSALPVAEQSIGGLMIAASDAKSISIRIARDGTVLHDSTFAPAYVVTPGPNGPDCDPKECKGATYTLPAI